jgi:hypothetical protein
MEIRSWISVALILAAGKAKRLPHCFSREKVKGVDPLGLVLAGPLRQPESHLPPMLVPIRQQPCLLCCHFFGIKILITWLLQLRLFSLALWQTVLPSMKSSS